jgi:adenylate cyclase
MRFGILVRLRPTLMTTVIGLVLLTALAIGGAAAILTLTTTRSLIGQARINVVGSASSEVEQFFDIAPRITDQLAAEARRGVLPLDDRDRLAALFAEQLRTEPWLSFIGYGNVEGGWYVGASRYGTDEIVEYVADPKVDRGVPTQAAVTADGKRSPPSVLDKEPYLVAARQWFQQGLTAPGPQWTPFYKFFTGGLGITCMTRFTAPGSGGPTGVFHADLRVEGIADFLSSLEIGEHGAVFLIDRDGRRVVDPRGDYVAAAAAAIDAAIDIASQQRETATLAHPARIVNGGQLYEIVFEKAPTLGDIGVSIGAVVDLRDISQGAYRHAGIAAGISIIVVLLATLFGRRLSSRIAEPIVMIARDLGQVAAFSISREPSPLSFVREVSELGASVDRMKASLRSFAHYVPTDLVRRLLAHGQEAELGGEIRRLTIYFSDIANFTSISEGMEPDRLVDAMGRYLDLMTGTITRHGGTVDKFIGDSVMAFFNAPEELTDHPRQACLAALEGQQRLAKVARDTTPGEPVFHTRIGLGLGDVLVGNIGTPERFAYTLLGDEVNLASRLEGLNKLYGTAIIASNTVMEEAGDGFEWRRLDRVAVKGRSQGTLVCELLGVKGEVAADILEARDLYEAGLDLYFAGEFERASELFEQLRRHSRDDLGAAMMRDRCYRLSSDPPLTWDGVHVMLEK